MPNCYYQILGLQTNASTDEIKKAYYKLSLRCHPDKNDNTDAKKEFQNISEAYSVLGDNEKKIKYDIAGSKHVYSNPQTTFEQFFKHDTDHTFGDMRMPFDMRDAFFNKKTRNEHSTNTAPQRKEKVSLSIEDMMNGIVKKIDTTRTVRCQECLGSGYVQNEKRLPKCQECTGRGIHVFTRKTGAIISRQSVICESCKGAGMVVHVCVVCKGGGTVVELETIEVNIPPGTHVHDVMTLKNKGNAPQGFDIPGDLILTFTMDEERYRRRLRNDLCIDIQITLSEALTGLFKSILHPSGRVINIKSDSIIRPNSTYRVDGLGFKMNGNTGDLLINYEVLYPDHLSCNQKKSILKHFFKPHNTNTYATTYIPECID